MADIEERILLIGQDENCDRLAAHLAREGYVVERAESVEALTHARAEQPVDADLVVVSSDARGIRELTSFLDVSKVPIIALNQPVTASDVVTTLRAGASDLVVVPFKDFVDADRVIAQQLSRVRLQKDYAHARSELERANRDLQTGLAELRNDQSAGRQVQQKMLPDRNQTFCGFHFDHMLKPSLYLSGDFLDYFSLSKNKAFFYLADVSGHGASSAFVTVLLKNLTNRLQRNLRRGSSDDILDPHRFLARVNKELIDTQLGKHLTIFAGILDVERKVLRYSLGAHYPMPIVWTNGHPHYLEGRGKAVGMMEDATYETLEVPIGPDFRLVAFSDGVLDVVNANSLAEKEALLLETVAQAGHTIGSLEKALGLDVIRDLPDDIAVLSIASTE
ncbi:SpoIIE family protein phosphatase [Hahella sp. SMD15-11]|uniref:SpoIIE family protein phosphatase n=1 Tax=Thermohahella caldifontis TaxID=3142973 RepID=A0AB39UXT9_9GAMM